MSDLEQLQADVQRLLVASENLRKMYEDVKEKEERLREECSDLKKKNELAKQKIDAIIHRLKDAELI
ncbi:MAG: TIGR02449 family protein [Pseudomonadota bacterium]|nr:TIGR02449 family protein [Pseudomonadota bacterium]